MRDTLDGVIKLLKYTTLSFQSPISTNVAGRGMFTIVSSLELETLLWSFTITEKAPTTRPFSLLLVDNDYNRFHIQESLDIKTLC